MMNAEHSLSLEDQTAAREVRAVRPHFVAVRNVGDVVPDVGRCVFHAGPPYRSPREIPAPVLHSAAQAAVFEGWCKDVAEAIPALQSGKIRMASAQEHRLLVPLAGVLTASMAVLEIADPARSLAPVWVALNEGQAHATRLGRIDHALVPHMRWLNGPFARWLGQCAGVPMNLLPLLVQAAAGGDDCHARTVLGSKIIAEALLQSGPQAADPIRAFLHDSPAFALNFWMGAAALAASAAEGVEGSAVVVRAGGNGVEFGIQLSGRPGEWICAPAPVPLGAIDPAHQGRRAVGALGDSAVVDFSGLGGQRLRTAPLVAQGLAQFLPHDVLERPARVLTCPEHDLAEGLCATSAAACAANRVGPLVLIGMIDDQGLDGRIGGGVVEVPVQFFEQALAAGR